jgi:hypothetical protein
MSDNGNHRLGIGEPQFDEWFKRANRWCRSIASGGFNLLRASTADRVEAAGDADGSFESSLPVHVTWRSLDDDPDACPCGGSKNRCLPVAHSHARSA